MVDNAYLESVEKQRVNRDEQMVANPRNWLSLVGLFWLEEGENPFGSGKENKIFLPTLPNEHCGCLRLENNRVFLTQASPNVTLNGDPAVLRELSSDVEEKPDLIEAGTISLMVIQRGDHKLVRAWDRDAQAVNNYKGLNYFPVNEQYRLVATFTPYTSPKLIMIHDVIGGQHESCILGQVHFSINGIACSLEVEDAEEEGLISFVDQTKIYTTYPGGRYLTLSKPSGEQVILDFNLASNWPCAYTSYATCPLPPSANHLPVRIEAGEMRYHE